MMKVMPLFLKLDNKPILVIGNGQMAEAKINLLTEMGANIKWLTLGAKISQEYAKNVTIIEKHYSEIYIKNCSLIFVATKDEPLIENIVATAQKHNILYNFVDMPEISQFITPAVVKRGDVMIAISTSGKAPVLARNLRQKINQILPHNLGDLVEFTYNFRPMAKSFITNSRKLFNFWNEVFSPQNISTLLAKNDANRQEFLIDMIECQKTRTGRIVEINLSSRKAEDLTLKAHRFINIADVIIYGDDMQDILNYARRDARRIFLNNEITVEKLVQSYLNNGDLVVYLKPINDNPKTYKNEIVSMKIT